MKLLAKLLLVALLCNNLAAYAGERYEYTSLYKINQKRQELFLVVTGDTLYLEMRAVDLPTYFVDLDTLVFDAARGYYEGRNAIICKPEDGYYELTVKDPERSKEFKRYRAFTLFRKATLDEYESYMAHKVAALRAKTSSIFFFGVSDARLSTVQKDSLRAYSAELYGKIFRYAEGHTFPELMIYNQQVIAEFNTTVERLSATKD